MGLIRSISTTGILILLFLSLLMMNTFLTISYSLEYDVLEPELVSVSTDIITEQVDIDLSVMNVHCLTYPDFVMDSPAGVIVLPCEKIAEGREATISYAVEQIVEENYYKDYGEDGFSFEQPFFLFSEQAKDYWNGWFVWNLVISLVLVGLLFISMENRNNIPLLVGILLVIASLPFIKLSWVFSLVSTWKYLGIFSVFFTQSYSVFLLMFVIGIILIGLWLVLKFVKFERFLGRIFGKAKKVEKDLSNEKELKSAVKDVVKKEMKSKKK